MTGGPRDDYRLIDNVRIPLAFEISRMAEGKKYPFWRGRITRLAFDDETLLLSLRPHLSR